MSEAMAAATEEGWEVAGGTSQRRKGRKGRGAAAAAAHAAPHGPAQPADDTTDTTSAPPTERQVQQRCAAVAAAASDAGASPLWSHLSQQLAYLPPHAALPAIRGLLVYGLGSLEQPGGVHIRYQLALARLLADALPALAAPPAAYDPVFTALDCAVLAALDMQVLSHDEALQRHVAQQPTLFWMPHCEAVLTDALLAANVAAGTLHNVVVLGNRFSGYQQAWELPRCRVQGSGGGGGGGQPERPATMLRLCECGAAQELAVKESRFPVASAFNDLGLHWFAPDWRARLAAAADGGSVSGQAAVS